jgi:hypothetical protein
MAGKMPSKSNAGEKKVVIEIITTQMEDAVVLTKEIPEEEDVEVEEVMVDAVEEETIEHLKNVECFNCGKKGHYSTDCSLPRKMTMNSQTWFPKRISKTYSNPH